MISRKPNVRRSILDATKAVLAQEQDEARYIGDSSTKVPLYTWSSHQHPALDQSFTIRQAQLSKDICDSFFVVEVDLVLPDSDMTMVVSRNDKGDLNDDPFAADFLQALAGFATHPHELCAGALRYRRQSIEMQA